MITLLLILGLFSSHKSKWSIISSISKIWNTLQQTHAFGSPSPDFQNLISMHAWSWRVISFFILFSKKKKKNYEISINSFTKVALIEKKKDQTGRSKPVQAPDVEVGRCWLFASPAGKEHWLPRRQGSNQEGPFVFNQPGDFVPDYSFVLELGQRHTGISASWSPVLSREFKWQQVVPQPGP